MGSILAEWFRSTFIKRRFTVLTFTGTFLVLPIQWTVNHFAQMPSDLRTASVWKAPWWLWALCFMGCLFATQVFAWIEQHKQVRELSGRPDVTVEISDSGGLFLLRVGNHRTAVDLTIQTISIPRPEIDMAIARRVAGQTYDDAVLQQAVYQREWIIQFSTEQAIHDENPGNISYRIPHLSAPNGENLMYVLERAATNNYVEVPITLVFSNLGPPKRTWHSHCLLTYTVSSKFMAIRHIDIGEVRKGQRVCTSSCCLTDGGKD